MFGWTRARCPVCPGTKRWVEMRMGWLIEQFGLARLRDRPLIVPSDAFFPEAFDGSEDAARVLFVRTCRYVDVDSARIDLEFAPPQDDGQFHPYLAGNRTGWTGMYDWQQQRPIVWVDSSHLADPTSLVATFAHELAHARLLGERRISPEEEDMELVTDLATVYFGLGVFTANTSFRDRDWSYGHWHHWRIARQGYLTLEMWSYALALFAWLRGETSPKWTGYLSATVRSSCRQGLAYLVKTGDADLATQELPDDRRPIDLLAEEIASKRLSDPRKAPCTIANEEDVVDSTSLEEPIEEDLPEDYQPEVVDRFTEGVFHAQAGRWQEAYEAFSAVIEDSPRDGEAHHQRVWALLALERTEEALADAERAVELGPDESDAYLARGAACLQAEQFDRAIADLTRYVKEEDVRRSDGTRPARGYYYRGAAYAGNGEWHNALSDYTRAIHLGPISPDLHDARAEAYEQLGNRKKADAERAEAERLRGR